LRARSIARRGWRRSRCAGHRVFHDPPLVRVPFGDGGVVNDPPFAGVMVLVPRGRDMVGSRVWWSGTPRLGCRDGATGSLEDLVRRALAGDRRWQDRRWQDRRWQDRRWQDRRWRL